MASDPLNPNLGAGTAEESMKSILGYLGQRSTMLDPALGQLTQGAGNAAGAYQNAIANQNTSQGLSPQALSALRTQGTSGITDQYQSAANALNTQLLRRGAAGQSGLPTSGGDYSRAFQPLYSSMEAAKTKAQTDTILADEAAKQKSLYQNQGLALNAANSLYGNANSLYNSGNSALGQAGQVSQALAQLEAPDFWKLLGTQGLTSLLTGTGAVGKGVDELKKLLGIGGDSVSPTTGLDSILNGNNPNTAIPSGQAAGSPNSAPVLPDLQSPNPSSIADLLSGIPGLTPNANGIIGGVQGAAPAAMGGLPLPSEAPTLPEGFGAPQAAEIGAGAAAAPAAAALTSGAAAAIPGLAALEAPAAGLLAPIATDAALGLGAAGGLGGVLGAVAGVAPAAAGGLPLAALAPVLPEGFGAPAAAAAGEAASGGLGSSLAALATNPITWAAAGVVAAAIIWHKSQSHQTADTWTRGYQGKFDSDMANVSDAFAKLKQEGGEGRDSGPEYGRAILRPDV